MAPRPRLALRPLLRAVLLVGVPERGKLAAAPQGAAGSAPVAVVSSACRPSLPPPLQTPP